MRRHALTLLAALGALTACSDQSPVQIVPGTPTQLSVATQPSAAAQSGAALAVQPVIRLKDTDGKPVALAGTVVTATTTTAGVTLANATATTDGTGNAHFSGLTLTGVVGPYTLHFASGTLTAVNAATVTLAAGAATQLGVTTQPSAAATAGSALAQQPSVQLRDGFGNAASQAGVTVNAAIVTGTATVSNATATTNGSGVALFSGLTLSGVTGSYTLRFTATGLGQADATAPTVLAAGSTTQLALITQPSVTAASTSALATQPVVQLKDAFGNNTTQAGVKVAATLVTAGGSTVQNDTAVSDATGKATFVGLRIAGFVGSYTFRFTAPSVASVVAAAPTALTAGPATKLVLTAQPSIQVANAIALPSQPVVQIQDSVGNPVAQSGVVVAASVVSGNPTIGGATATTDATGKATFVGLTLTTVVGFYSFQFTAPSLTTIAANSSTQVLPGTATQMSVTVAPATQGATTGTSGVPLNPQPIVILQDVSHNTVSQSGVGVSVSVFSGGNPVLSNATAQTNGGGQAVFSGLTFTGAGTYQIRFSASGLTSLDAPNSLVIN